MISLQALGPVAVTIDGAAAPPELLWRKHLALLVYLARSPRRTRTRDHLVGLLWSDKAESAARHSLNEALRVIRRAAGDGAITTQGEQVTLEEGVVILDADQLASALASGKVADAASLVAGEFLEGFTVPGASGFEDWLATERQGWAAQSIAALVGWSDAEAKAGRLGAATAAAERALALDPLSETAMMAWLRAQALAGERAAALARYDGYAELLRERLGTVPSATVAALAERIRRDRSGGRQGQGAATASERRAPLAGRVEQLQAAGAVWAGVRSTGRAAVLAIVGDAGTGKSRLAEEVMARARLDGAAVTVMRAVPADQAEEGAGLLALASGGLVDAAGVAGAAAEALGALAEASPVWRERFPSAAGGAGVTVTKAIGAVLRTASEEQPVAVLVDDAHWLDESSVLGLESLLRDLAARPVLVVLTVPVTHDHRSLEGLASRIGRDLPGAIVRLAPLGGDALREMVRWAMPSWSPDQVERLARRLALDSAGLPLLVVELLDAVLGGLDLAASPGAWPVPLRTLDQTLPGDLPDTITSAIRVSYRRLGPAGQKVAAAAAVLPEPVTSSRLARATELPKAEVEEALDALEWARWLQADGRGYRYVARIVREVVGREMVTAGQRLRMVKGEK
ncbi:MAG TPA: AAA family ATPase [Gemmatimonadales bacterium]